MAGWPGWYYYMISGAMHRDPEHHKKYRVRYIHTGFEAGVL